MIEYDSRQSNQLHPRTSEQFGGFSFTLDDWNGMPIDEKILDFKVLADVYEMDIEDYTLKELQNSILRDDEFSVPIVLLHTESGSIKPLFIQSRSVSISHRGRKEFQTISRNTDHLTEEVSTSKTEFTGEEVPSESEQKPIYDFYTTNNVTNPRGYLSTHYNRNKFVVTSNSQEVLGQLTDVYVPTDELIYHITKDSEIQQKYLIGHL